MRIKIVNANTQLKYFNSNYITTYNVFNLHSLFFLFFIPYMYLFNLTCVNNQVVHTIKEQLTFKSLFTQTCFNASQRHARGVLVLKQRNTFKRL
jgi:hypothetical protein